MPPVSERSRRALAALVLCLMASGAQAQSVQQSGSVTPGHVPVWATNGVIKDGGTAANGNVTSFGVTNNGGPGICLNSAAQTASAYNSLCFAVTTNGGAKISSYSYGTATNAGIEFDVNGSLQGFPLVNLPVSIDDAACFAATTGTLKACTAQFGGFANPTASVGLTAVNGAATTAMRSDAAPPIDQSISPSWTGTHTFQSAKQRVLGSSTGYTSIASANAGATNYTFTLPAENGTAITNADLATNAAKGIMEGDGTSITCTAGVCSTLGTPTVAIYETKAAAAAATISSSITGLRTNSYATQGDNGQAFYSKMSCPATQPWQFASADGACWTLTVNPVLPEQLGAIGDGTTNDTTAVQNAVNYGCNTTKPGNNPKVLLDKLFGIASTINVSQVCASNGYEIGGSSFRRSGLVALAGLGANSMLTFTGNVSPNVIQGVYIHDLFFNCASVATNALVLTDVDDGEVARNVMINCRSHNIDVVGIDGLHVTFRQNRFSQASVIGTPAAIYIEGGTNYLVEQNYFGGTQIGLRAAGDTVSSFRNIYEGNPTGILWEGGSQMSLNDYFGTVTTKMQVTSNNPLTVIGARGLVYSDITYSGGFTQAQLNLQLETPGVPTISSCGTSPTVAGTNLSGHVVVGSGGTGCTMTFAPAFANSVTCTVTDRSRAITYTASVTALVVSGASPADIIDWTCKGY